MINNCRYFVCSVNNSRYIIILDALLSKLCRFLACALAYFTLTGNANANLLCDEVVPRWVQRTHTHTAPQTHSHSPR